MAVEADAPALTKRANVVVRTLTTAFADTNATAGQRAAAAGKIAVGAGAGLGAVALGTDFAVTNGQGLYDTIATAATTAATAAFTVPAVDAAVPAIGVLGAATLLGRYFEQQRKTNNAYLGKPVEIAEGHRVTGSFLAKVGFIGAGALGVAAAAMAVAPDLGMAQMSQLAHGAANTAEVFGGVGVVAAGYSGYWKHRVSTYAARAPKALAE